MDSIQHMAWTMRDEGFYEFLKQKYADRQKLSKEAEKKRRAAESMKDDHPHFHRMAVSADMAALRLDMAYIVDRNNQLEQMIGSIEYMFQRLGILEGAYGHVKILAEGASRDYTAIAKGLKEIAKIKEELSNGVAQRSPKPDGTKG